MAKKTTKKAAKRKGGKGKRYSPEAKQEVIDFVNEVNAAKGRGGVASAARKFGVSPLSIGNWLKGGGGAKPGRRKGSVGAKPARRGRPVGGGGNRDRDRVLSDLTGLNREISRKRNELASLEARFEKLKTSL